MLDNLLPILAHIIIIIIEVSFQLIFSSTLLLFDDLAYKIYILPERSDEEYIEHHKNTLSRV